MPLIIVVGGPSSGKTRRATELAEHFTKVHSKNVVLINEEALKLNKAECYKDVTSEKMLRLSIKSAVDKSLAGSTIVIADSQNYIKGTLRPSHDQRHRIPIRTLLPRPRPADHRHDPLLQYSTRGGQKVERAPDRGPLSSRVVCIAQSHDPRLGWTTTTAAWRCRTRTVPAPVPQSVDRWDQPLFVVSPGDALWLEKIDEAVLHGQKPKNPISTKKVSPGSWIGRR